MVSELKMYHIAKGDKEWEKFFFECSNGEHSTNVKLSWKVSKSFAALSNGATARLIKLGKNISRFTKWW